MPSGRRNRRQLRGGRGLPDRVGSVLQRGTTGDIGRPGGVPRWLDAETSGDSATANFIYGGFPDRLRVATDAWLAEDPFENPDAPVSPFVMEEYVVLAALASQELAEAAEAQTIAAREATEWASDYVLTTVLFATVLFFASISTKLTGEVNQWVMFSVAVIGLVAGVVVLLALPRAP